MYATTQRDDIGFNLAYRLRFYAETAEAIRSGLHASDVRLWLSEGKHGYDWAHKPPLILARHFALRHQQRVWARGQQEGRKQLGLGGSALPNTARAGWTGIGIR